jgi:colanic acid/amylovoran biosynthesis glycosyltransferase
LLRLFLYELREQKKNMKITFIVKEFPKISETFIMSQVTGLAGRGHDVRVVSLKKPRLPDSLHNNKTPDTPYSVYYVGYESSGLKRFISIAYRFIYHLPDSRFIRFLFRLPKGLEIMLYKIAQSEVVTQADVVLIHYGDLAYLFAVFCEKLGIRTPFAAVFHGVDVARYMPSFSHSERQRLFNAMSLGLPVSRFWRDRLESLDCPGDKLTVHHMGVDAERFRCRERSPNDESLRIVTVGRLVEKKGIDVAVRSFETAVRSISYKRLVFEIVGDGPERGMLDDLVKSLGIEEQVIFHGRQPTEKTIEILDSADIFVLASRTAKNGDMEGIPVSLMEAMALGLPVISTYHSGIPELVSDGVSGLLVKENTDEELANALIRLIKTPDLRIRLGAEARQVILREFNLQSLTATLENILNKIAGRTEF